MFKSPFDFEAQIGFQNSKSDNETLLMLNQIVVKGTLQIFVLTVIILLILIVIAVLFYKKK